jgi:hypothetical protein
MAFPIASTGAALKGKERGREKEILQRGLKNIFEDGGETTPD